MRLVMVVFTALSLSACNVEGPEAGEAKFTPEGEMNWEGAGRIKQEFGGGSLIGFSRQRGVPATTFCF